MQSSLLIRAAVGAGAVALVLSGCASSSSSGGSGTSATGPVRIGMFATTSAQSANAFVNVWSVDGVTAAVNAVNKAGGIKGRQLELVVCDNGGDPNRDATCARKAVQDNWLAVVGGFDPYAPNQTMPVLEKAGIPYIGYLQSTPVEYQSTVSFPIEVGTIGGNAGTFTQMKQDGCRKAVFVNPQDAGADDAKKLFDTILPGAAVIPFATGTTDVTPVVASALALQPDCIMQGGAGPDIAKTFAAVRKAGSDAQLYAAPGSVQPQIVAGMGAIAEGLKGAASAPLPNNPDPAMKQFFADLAAYKTDAPPTEFTINGWGAVQLLKTVGETVDTLDAGSLAAALAKTTTELPPFGRLDFTATREGKVYRRVPNANVWFSVVKGGQWTAVDPAGAPTNVEQYLP